MAEVATAGFGGKSLTAAEQIALMHKVGEHLLKRVREVSDAITSQVDAALANAGQPSNGANPGETAP